MWWRRLINRPIVERWIPNWVLSVELSKIHAIRLLDLSELEGDWCWVVGDEILERRNGYVVIQKSEVVLLGLSELESDWCWMVSDEVLESRNGDVVI